MLAERIIEGEIIAPGSGVDVWYRPDPFRTSRQHFRADAALSIAEIVSLARDVYGVRPNTSLHVSIDGEPVSRDWWARVRVKSGVAVTIVAVPKGNFFKQILGIVAAIAVAIFMPYVGAFVGTLGLTGAAASIATGLIGAGLTIAASLTINALFPTASTNALSESTKQLYSIGGASNKSAQYAAIPVIFGTHRISPPYASGAYTEINGDDQYLRMLFCVGYGNISVSNIKIGETDIGDYPGCQWEVIQDSVASQTTLYSSPVYEEAVSVKLLYSSGWSTRTTPENIDWLSVDLNFPNGIYRYKKSDGNRDNYTVSVAVQYSPKDANNWTTAAVVTITGYKAQGLRRSVALAVPRGQYDVRVCKSSSDYSGDDTVSEDIYWTAIRARRNTKAVAFPKPLTLLALYIKATDELNGIVDRLNLIATPKIRSWNGSSWVDHQATQNPADHFRYVLQGTANARPAADSQIDLQSLQDWWAYCNANGFKFNYVSDNQKSVYETLSMIAAAGRAAVTFNDGKWGVVWDVSSSPIVQHFSPRNSWNFASTRAYADLPHAFRVAFINQSNNYINDERVVYDDGYDVNNATKFEGLDFPGVTDPSLIWRHGRYHIAQLRLQRETYSLNTDFEHLVCQRGDRVRVNYDTVLWGAGAARVKSVVTSPQGVVIDDSFSMVAGKTYTMRFRKSDGSSVLRTIIGANGDFSSFTFADSGGLPDPGDLCLFGENALESVVLRVKSITPSNDLSAKIEMVDDAPGIMMADKGAIPDFVTGIAASVNYRSFAPKDLTWTERVWTQVPATSAISVSWTGPTVSNVRNYIVQYAEYGSSDWSKSIYPTANTADIVDLAPGVYNVRVRAVFENGELSNWLTQTVTVAIFNVTPPQVTGFRIAVSGNSALLQWDPIVQAGLGGYQIRFSPQVSGVTWQTATVLRERDPGPSSQVPAMRGTYLIKAVTYGGLYSEVETSIVSTIDPATAFNAVASVSDTAFAGTKQNTSSNGSELRLVTLGDVFQQSDIFTLSDFFLAGGGYVPVGYYYLAGYTDLLDVYTSRLTASISAYGESASEDVFARADFFGVSDVFGNIESVWDVKIDVSTTNDDPAGAPTWSDWTEMTAGDVSARALRFRLQLLSYQYDISPVVADVNIQIDMPDRILADSDLTVTTSGRTITFSPAYKVLQGLSIAAQGMNTGDYYQITGKSEAGFTIIFKNAAGTPVLRTLDYVAKGYGIAA